METKQRFIVGIPTIKHIDALANYNVYNKPELNAIDLVKNKSILIIADPSFYMINQAEIVNWCNQSLTSWKQTGMIIGFINDEERNLFLMRWA